MDNEKLILNKLDLIKVELDYIKEHIVDITLTEDDLTSLKEADDNFKKRKTTPHGKIKKELGL